MERFWPIFYISEILFSSISERLKNLERPNSTTLWYGFQKGRPKKGNPDFSKRDHKIVLNYFSKLGKNSNSAYGLKI